MIYCASTESGHHQWPVYGLPICSPAPRSSWISPASPSTNFTSWFHPLRRRSKPIWPFVQPHQRATPVAHAAAIYDEHHRLQGEMTQQDVRIGQKVHLLQDVGVVAPPRKAFDAAFGLGAIGDLRGDVG